MTIHTDANDPEFKTLEIPIRRVVSPARAIPAMDGVKRETASERPATTSNPEILGLCAPLGALSEWPWRVAGTPRAARSR